MTDRTFDPNSWLETYRDSFESVRKAQREGLKVIERLARFQYAVAGDCLDAGLAHAQAATTTVKSPADLFTKQVELTTRLSEKFQSRAQEFLTLASEVQGTVSSLAAEAAGRATGPAKKAA